MAIWNKAVDKWGDWQAAQHIAKKYDDDGYLRKKEQHKQKIRGCKKKFPRKKAAILPKSKTAVFFCGIIKVS